VARIAPELIEDFLQRNFKKGAVIRTSVTFTNPPKIKILAVLGIHKKSDRVLIAVFNSNLNLRVLNSDNMRECQMEIKASKADYISHDSYLDCALPKEYQLSIIKKKLRTKPSELIGQMSARDLKQALNSLRNADTISPKIKKKYGLL